MLLRKIRMVRGLADVRMQQPESSPELRVDVDRARIAQLGLSERDVTNSLVTTLAGSSQGAPTYWVNPKTGVSYPIVAQTPEYRLNSISGLENVPINGSAAGNSQALILGGLIVFRRQAQQDGRLLGEGASRLLGRGGILPPFWRRSIPPLP